MIRVTELCGWRCPKCHRISVVPTDKTGVKCSGDPAVLSEAEQLWHGIIDCRRVDDELVDPLELARVAGLVPR